MRQRNAIKQIINDRIHGELAGMNVDNVLARVFEYINMSKVLLCETALMPQLVILRDMVDRIDVDEVRKIIRYSMHDKRRLEQEAKMLEAGEVEKP